MSKSASVSPSARRKAGPVIAAALVAAALTSWARAQELIEGFIIVAPATVWAGDTIFGFATGGAQPMVIRASWPGGNIPGFPMGGFGDPLYFAIPTSEPMAGSGVLITAIDAERSARTHWTSVQ